MKVAMIDPSLFMIPYDRELCAALEQRGATVRLIGRRLREGERQQLHGREVDPLFYRFAERPFVRKALRGARLVLKGFDHPLSLRRLTRELETWQPDVIHFQWFALPFVDRLFLGRLGRIAPVVATVHDSTPFNANPSSRLQRLSAYAAIASCDRVIVHTRRAVSVLAGRGVSPERIARIPCGILEQTGRGEPAPRAGRATHEKTRFLQFGIVKPYKGVDVLVKAVGLLSEEARAGCEFIVAGRPGMDVAGLVALKRDLAIGESLKFDFRYFSEEEMQQLFSDADVLVFPYREIDASGVLYASLPHGKPIIATRIGVFDELLRDGVHGILTAPDDAAELARAIGSLQRNAQERVRMGEQVRALSSAVTSWGEIAELTAETYRSAIGARR